MIFRLDSTQHKKCDFPHENKGKMATKKKHNLIKI